MISAQQGVINIAAYVAAHDATAREGQQITDWFRNAAKRHPLATRAALTYLGLHLTGDLPRQLDVISALGWLIAHTKAA